MPLWSVSISQRGQSIQWGRDTLANKWCWENWTDTYKKMKVHHQLISHTRIISKQIKVLNLRFKTIKLLEENIGSKISDVSCSNIFSDISSGKGNKIKNQQDYIKLNSFYTAKETINKIKRQPWLVWLSGSSASLRNKGSLVPFPVRAHAWVVVQVPVGVRKRQPHIDVSLPLFLSLPSSLKINKYNL